MELHTFRLKSGCLLKESIEEYVRSHNIQAGVIVTCVGSLSKVAVRMAGASPESQDIRDYTGLFEIVSLVGTVARNGTHLHLSFSDKDGRVIGGHLKDGTVVHTTAEVVIGEHKGVVYSRETDAETGFLELIVRK